MANNGTCANVQMDSTAIQLMDEFDVKADEMINNAPSDIDMQLWNRAHLKALKLAAVIAVGCNPHAPVVTQDIATWSIGFVERDVAVMTTRFQQGEMGLGDHRLEADIRRMVEAYLVMPMDKRAQYKVAKTLLAEPVIPFSYLRRRLRLLASFKNDRRGLGRALDDTLKDMVKGEILRIIPTQQVLERFGVMSELYTKGPAW